MRDCQPTPFLRKKVTTSGSSRSDTRVLSGFDFCGPRWPRIRRKRSGPKGRAFFQNLLVSGGLSGSANAAAVMAASSSSVILSALSRAMRRASAQLRGPRSLLDRSFMVASLLPIGLAQADHPDHVTVLVHSPSEDQNMRDGANETSRLLSQFTVILTIVDVRQRPIPVELINRAEVDTMISHVLPTLSFIPIVPASLQSDP